MLKTKTRIFNISSLSDSQNSTMKSRILISLPDLTFHNNIQNVMFSVLHAEVPNSFYVINQTNNILIIDNISYLIPSGNYNANTLLAMMFQITPAGFNITYSSTTNKYSFSNTADFTISGLSSIGRIIGMNTLDLTSSSNTLELPHSVNFIPVPRINFKSNFFNFNNFNLADKSNDLFLSLQNGANQNSMINYINQTNIKFQLNDRSITTFIISATDDYGNLLDFNNQDWFLTFQIDIEYLDFNNPSITFNNLISK